MKKYKYRPKPSTNTDRVLRPKHIEGSWGTPEWWRSNNKAYCDAVMKAHPERVVKYYQ